MFPAAPGKVKVARRLSELPAVSAATEPTLTPVAPAASTVASGVEARIEVVVPEQV